MSTGLFQVALLSLPHIFSRLDCWLIASIFPLLEKDELVLPYVVCLVTFLWLAVRLCSGESQQPHPLESVIPSKWLDLYLAVRSRVLNES